MGYRMGLSTSPPVPLKCQIWGSKTPFQIAAKQLETSGGHFKLVLVDFIFLFKFFFTMLSEFSEFGLVIVMFSF